MASTIGAALKAARKANGLSVRDLADATGLSSGHISQIESGTRADPAFGSVVRLSQAIGVSLDALVSDTPAATSLTDAGLLEQLEKLHHEAVRITRRIQLITEAFRKTA